MSIEESLAAILSKQEELEKTIQKLSEKKPDAHSEPWQYYTKKQALSVLGITNSGWKQTWSQYRDNKGNYKIPRYFNGKYVKKKELEQFIESTKISR